MHGLETLHTMLADPEQILRDFKVENCRVCVDVKEWRKRAQKSAFANLTETPKADQAVTAVAESSLSHDHRQCPPHLEELGRSTWTFLHTLSVYYPDNPTSVQKADMSIFLSLFSKFYPCTNCSEHLRGEMEKNPPVVESRSALARWMCRTHNKVNAMLGKPHFDCDKVDERWRDGPADGSCD
jgi:mitochondrial FAD-linked sulfhydryl oxidase